MRHNAPYNIAYDLGASDGRAQPDRPEDETLLNAKRIAASMAHPFSGSASTRRYYRELGAAYLAGVSAGKGRTLTEQEWVETYKHPVAVYELMRHGNSLERQAHHQGEAS